MQAATAGRVGRVADLATYATAVLCNGLGRHEAAREAAWQVFERDHVGYGPLVVPELIEAASRTGDVGQVKAALEWLSERTRVTPTEWALGVEAHARALLSHGDVADGLYRESIERLGRTRVRVELARAHLLYGEWLRRENRRVDARAQLRTAHEMFASMGTEAFADRARRELLATGETVRTNRGLAPRAHRPRRADRPARPQRALEPRDRRPAVHQSAHGPVPLAQGLHEARHHLAQPARPRRPARLAAVAPPAHNAAPARPRLATPAVHWRMRPGLARVHTRNHDQPARPRRREQTREAARSCQRRVRYRWRPAWRAPGIRRHAAPRAQSVAPCLGWSRSCCSSCTASIRTSRSSTSWARWSSCQPKESSDASDSLRSRCPRSKPARAITPVATVQNLYNLADRRAEPVLDHCERESIGFIMVPDGRRPPGPTRRAAAADRQRAAVTPPSSRWRGCCGVRRSCSRSPARRRSPIPKRTWARC